ncbi:NAD(P)-binding protein [Coprinopsis marcescibilis]|uniref:NAD(P)-binding protein n=1 Tax=Coprinopsis marcescibilis TaxID=230819 RepID=A0A5C3KQM2_COPMA|nr:NAD(P)-binding protein [Coprinopsis marcescibilis]
MSTGNGGDALAPIEVTGNRMKMRPRWIPTIEYTVQNMMISMATIVAACASLFFTSMVVLPLAFTRALFSRRSLTLLPPPASLKRGKVVLIVGASRGIGLEVLKQYCPEPGTTVIAVSKNADSMRNALIQLGDTPATLQMETIDLAGSPKAIAEAISILDEKYGPISHLYAISGISNHLKDGTPWNVDVAEQMIRVNVSGTVAMAMTMYERMKGRKYGKICIVGSVAGLFSPANMITYASTKAFINNFSTSLRVLASASNIDVVTVEPGFIDTRMTQKMRGQGSTVPGLEFASAESLASRMKSAVERGGVGVVSFPIRQSVMMSALKAVNPICEEVGRYWSMKSGMAGKKIT